MAELKTRGADRRWHDRGPGRLLPERRDGFDRRAQLSGAVVAGPTSVRPGYGETRPFVERRRYPESGME